MLNYLQNPNLFIQKAFIAGSWCDSASGQTIEVFNPANNLSLGKVPSCSAAEVRSAIEAAQIAQKEWRKKPAKDRSLILKKWQALIVENQDDLAKIISLEMGKPFAEAKVEVLACANYAEWFAEEAKRAYGDIIPSNRKDTRVMVLKEPLGVVATITPWNFPALMLARKAAAALAAGCSVVSKPAELTPYSALALAYLAQQAGLPDGAWNIVNGDAQLLGHELCLNPIVKKVSFTGSTKIGKLLMQQCSGTVKKLSLELGGNAPFIVFESADIASALQGAVFGKFRNNGQTCICVNRFFVHESIYDSFRDQLIEKIKNFKLGSGLDQGVEIGPLINETAVCKVENQIKDALSLGARLCLGGQRSKLGYSFFEPTVLDQVTDKMLVAREETFGPLVALFKFRDENEVINLANSTEFGLAGYFYSNDLGQIWRVAEQLELGMVGVNETVITTENIPFGGVKESGFGREGSKYGLEDYLQIKYVCLGGVS